MYGGIVVAEEGILDLDLGGEQVWQQGEDGGKDGGQILS